METSETAIGGGAGVGPLFPASEAPLGAGATRARTGRTGGLPWLQALSPTPPGPWRQTRGGAVGVDEPPPPPVPTPFRVPHGPRSLQGVRGPQRLTGPTFPTVPPLDWTVSSVGPLLEGHGTGGLVRRITRTGQTVDIYFPIEWLSETGDGCLCGRTPEKTLVARNVT